jgi:hypothetical protein
MARRPAACVGGQGRAGGQVKGAAAHPEVVRRASKGGGRRRVTNRVAAGLGTCRGSAMGGGDSGRLAPIPLSRNMRELRRSSWHAWLLAERHQMAGLGGVHCGELGHALEKAGEGESMRVRERRGYGREEGLHGVQSTSRGSPRWPERRAGGGKAPARELRAGACLVEEETKGVFHIGP